MIVRYFVAFLICAGALSVYAQEFETDIAPLLRRECIDCHGRALQMSGLRLDRYDDALQVIEPGASEESLLIQRLVDKDLGVLMPPKFGDGSGLAEKEIETLRAWIQAGAEWPAGVHLAEQAQPSKETIRAAALRELIRNGEFRKVEELLKVEPNPPNIPNEQGSTALHAACLYGDPQLVRTLIARGAQVNVSDADGVTPLMLAVHDIEKVRVLLKAGADKYAVSKLERTPLEIAATYSGNVEVVRLLLSPPLPESSIKLAVDRALENAALVLDVEMVRELMAKGGTGKNPGLFFLTRSGSPDVVKLLLEAVGSEQTQPMLDAALSAAAYDRSTDTMRMLLDREFQLHPSDQPQRCTRARDTACKLADCLMTAVTSPDARCGGGQLAEVISNYARKPLGDRFIGRPLVSVPGRGGKNARWTELHEANMGRIGPRRFHRSTTTKNLHGSA